jgi:hypothetical protein
VILTDIGKERKQFDQETRRMEVARKQFEKEREKILSELPPSIKAMFG